MHDAAHPVFQNTMRVWVARILVARVSQVAILQFKGSILIFFGLLLKFIKLVFSII